MDTLTSQVTGSVQTRFEHVHLHQLLSVEVEEGRRRPKRRK